MRTSAPKEDPAVKAEREREKAISEGERRYAASRNAASMTTDYNAVYGRRSLFDRGVVAQSDPLRETGGTGLQRSGNTFAPPSLLQRDRTGMTPQPATPSLTPAFGNPAPAPTAPEPARTDFGQPGFYDEFDRIWGPKPEIKNFSRSGREQQAHWDRVWEQRRTEYMLKKAGGKPVLQNPYEVGPRIYK